jgi:hypothetical protein
VVVFQVEHQELAQRRDGAGGHGRVGGRLGEHRRRAPVDVVHQRCLNHGQRFGHGAFLSVVLGDLLKWAVSGDLLK